MSFQRVVFTFFRSMLLIWCMICPGQYDGKYVPSGEVRHGLPHEGGCFCAYTGGHTLDNVSSRYRIKANHPRRLGSKVGDVSTWSSGLAAI